MFDNKQDKPDNILDSGIDCDPWYSRYLNKWDWFSLMYLIDWIICIIIIITTEFLLHLFVTPHKSYLIPGDSLLSYPYTTSTIPGWLLMLVEISPLFIISIYLLLVEKSNLAHELHHGILGWLESCASTFLISNALKYICGRYRPDYFSRIISNVSKSEIINGSLSFPSGHSSGSFFAMTFLFLYIVGKTKAFKRGHFYLFLLCAIPLYLASWIAITRLHDYKHNYSDVLAGAIIGCICGMFGYFLNFESLFSEKSGKPRNIKKESTSMMNIVLED